MLSKKELEEIIAAWPDENGVWSNPQLIERWEAQQNQYFSDKVHYALGGDRIAALSPRQIGFLNRALGRLKDRKSVFDITHEEILGQYELVTEHLSPFGFEAVVENYNRRQKMN